MSTTSSSSTATADARIDPRHPFAAHLRHVAALGEHPSWTPDDGPLPALHLSHGDFDAWAADALDRGDVEELARFLLRAPGLRYAHPTVEHFTPLFVTLGAATDPAAGVTTAIDGFFIGLARRSFQVA